MANLLQAGQRFGKLTVIKVSDNKRSWSPLDYECLCDCGLARESQDKPLKKKFINMAQIGRCFNSNDSNFHNYKGNTLQGVG